MTWPAVKASLLRLLPVLPRFTERFLWPAALLAGGIVLLQVHAIPYWQAHTGSLALGMLWSLQLEATAMWLLYQPGKNYRRAGYVTAALLIGVPLWNLSQPVVNRFDTIQSTAGAEQAARIGKAESRREAQVELQRGRVDTYRAQLKVAADAQAAAVYAPPEVQRPLAVARARAQSRLDDAERKLEAKLNAPEARAPETATGIRSIGWLDWLRAVGDIAPSAASLILFQSVNVLAIVSISRYRHEGQPNPAPPRAPPPGRKPAPATETAETQPLSSPPPAPETPAPAETKPAPERPVSSAPQFPVPVVARGTGKAAKVDEVTIHRLQHVLAERIKAVGSAAKWCEQERVNPRDLSFLMNHASRGAKGEPTISAPKLAELVDRFLPPQREKSGN